ncbi:MAG: YbaB/EbfC family nucleoid-associated protein [Pseudomonadota bacterium]|nr:YbaB/EbfC family nucleoid-associated protein [Pseudomonadota bacterium]MEC9022147.1 YbaB/EbfC family nucleoid-associated protein [Pseudomonadota bacterium]
MKNFGQMMKQAQEMQSKIQEMQDQLTQMEVEGNAGGGLVTVTLSGKNELKKLSVDPSLFNSKDVEVLEDLIVAAHADARKKVEEAMKEQMSKMTGGLGLPPGMTLPF